MSPARPAASKNGPMQGRRSVLMPDGTVAPGAKSRMEEELLLEAARDAGREVQVLERRGAGRDHPVLLGVPETRYLKCLVARIP